MGDLTWLAAVPHKNIGGSSHNLSSASSFLLAASRSASAISFHGLNEDHNFVPEQPSNASFKESNWKPQMPNVPAIKGAWQQKSLNKTSRLKASNNLCSRPGSAHSGLELNVHNSRPSSARNELDATLSVYKTIKQHKGKVGKNGTRHDLDSSHLGSRSVHSRPNSAHRSVTTRVDGAGSVNKGLEYDIEYLQGSVLGEDRAYDKYRNEDYGAEFIKVTEEKALSPRPRSANSRGSSTDLGLRRSRSHTDTDDSRSSKGSNSRSGSRQGSGKSGHSSRLGSGLKGKSDLNYVVEDLEKDATIGGRSGGQGFPMDTDNGVPKIIIGENLADKDLQEPETKKVKTKTETLADARKRKLLMKLKYATAFKSLFNEARAESERATLDMDQCYNVQELGKAKAEERKEQERFKNVSALKHTLPSGVPLKTNTEIRSTKSRTQSSGLNLSEAGHHMLSPESLAIMKTTLGEKSMKNFGEQPWLLGRLALSKQTCRFELPMDMLVLKTITPMDYLLRYCIISRRRKTLYRNVFQRVDKDRDGWISNEELVKALKDIHVNYIDQREIDVLCEMLHLDKSTKTKYNTMMFSVISAFSERLVLYLRKLDRRKDKGLKERLEVADFSNLRWKIEGVDVNPPVKRIIEVL